MSIFLYIGFIAILLFAIILATGYAILKRLDEIDKKLKKESSWKPTEEEMKALYKTIEFFQENRYVWKPLLSLYEQLKKMTKLQ